MTSGVRHPDRYNEIGDCDTAVAATAGVATTCQLRLEQTNRFNHACEVQMHLLVVILPAHWLFCPSIYGQLLQQVLVNKRESTTCRP